MKTFNKTKFILLVGFFCLLSMNSMAAQRDSCDDKGVGGCYEKLLDQQHTMIGDVNDLLGAIDEAGIFSLIRIQTGADVKSDLEARIEGLRNDHRRASEVNEATSDDEYDAMLLQGDKETGKNCKSSDKPFYDSIVEELDNPNADILPDGYTSVGDNFGNGKCDVFSAVVDGETVKVNERKENMCEKVCVDKKNSNDVSRRGESKGRFLESMEESISSGRKASLTISMQTARIRELGVLFSELQASETITEDTEVCDVSGDIKDLDKETPEEELRNAIAIMDGIVIATDVGMEVLDTVKDLADKACGQDALGANANIACVASVSVYHIASGLNGVLKNVITVLGNAKDKAALNAGRADAKDAHNARSCLKEVKSEVTSIKGDLNSVKESGKSTDNEIAVLKSKLDTLLKLVEGNRQLLLTPSGLRGK